MKPTIRYTIAAATMSTLLASVAWQVSAGNSHSAELQTPPTVSIDEAIEITRSTVKGNLIEVELEHEDGKALWEMELIDNQGQEIEVLIDAQTGQVLEQEIDS